MAKTIDDRDDMILEFIKRRYDAEIEKIMNLDGKASNLIGFVAVVVGLIVEGGAFKDAIRFVSSNQSKEKSLANNNEDEKVESKEPDYDEDEDQLEEKQ